MRNNGESTEIILRIHNTNPRLDDTVDRGPYVGNIDAFHDFYSNLAWALHPTGSVYIRRLPPREPGTSGGLGEQELLVSMLSGVVGAALTALYQVIHSYLTKDSARELTL